MTYSKVLLIIFLCIISGAGLRAQCQRDFSVKSFPSERGLSTGSIEISCKESIGFTSIKIFRISGQPELVRQENSQFDKVLILKNLEPSDYVVRLEWMNCSKDLGGIAGIEVNEKPNRGNQ